MENNCPSYAVHDKIQIKGFFAEYRFLSNFWICPNGVWFHGLKYNSSESAYQAQRVKPEYRNLFVDLEPNIAKKEYKKYPLCYDNRKWKLVRIHLMTAIVFSKFFDDVSLRIKLLKTGNRYLEEKNDWKDVFWGCDVTLGGENKLGIILMKIRDFWVGLF